MNIRLPSQFWRVLTASGLSNLADGIVKTAVPLIAVRFTTSPLAIGGLAFALTLPWLLFSLPAGAIIDRSDRRRVMLIANTGRAIIAALLAVALFGGVQSIILLYVCALLVGITEVFYDTGAQSLLPQVVARDQLAKANSRLYAAEVLANQLLGPPLGGFLVGIVGIGIGLAAGIPAAIWGFALVALFSLAGSYVVNRGDTHNSITADIAEGMRYLVRHRILRMLAIMTGVSNLGFAMFFGVVVLYLVGPDSAMRLTDAQYGLILTFTALGSLLGAAIANRVATLLGRQAALGVGVFTMAAPIIALVIGPIPWLYALASVLSGLGIMVWNVVAVSLRQQITPDGSLGRMNSCYRLVSWGTMPIGSLLGGLIGQMAGIRVVFWVALVFSLAVAFGLFTLTNTAIAQSIQANTTGDASALGAAAGAA